MQQVCKCFCDFLLFLSSNLSGAASELGSHTKASAKASTFFTSGYQWYPSIIYTGVHSLPGKGNGPQLPIPTTSDPSTWGAPRLQLSHSDGVGEEGAHGRPGNNIERRRPHQVDDPRAPGTKRLPLLLSSAVEDTPPTGPGSNPYQVAMHHNPHQVVIGSPAVRLMRRLDLTGCQPWCWAELRGWSFTRSCFRGWTLAQNQASLDWASSVDKQEKARVFKF